MKRRLTRAYDHMTMPDACAHRIEQRLQQEMEIRKSGQYTKVITPASPHRGGWAAAVVAVCLMLILSVGGTMLFLRVSDQMLTIPDETLATDPTDKVRGDYSIVTDYSAEQVENFARMIRKYVLEENWEALATRISYTVTIQDQEVRDKWKFIDWMEIFALNPSFIEAIQNETCEDMFCNWQGVCMGDGKIWFNEVSGALKITAVNVEPSEAVLGKNQKKQVPMAFAEILRGNAVKYTGNREEMILEEYCAALFGDVTVNGFAVVDMDHDTVCEVVISVQSADQSETGHLVLRQEDGEICSYPFWRNELYDLKKDGSFSRSSYGPSQGSFWLSFHGDGGCSITQEHIESDAPEAQWHCYPCQRPELVLQSYEYVTGTGQSLLPGNPYYHFEGLVLGSMGNDWNLQKEQLLRYGMACVEDEGTVSVFDPDAPGTALYGTLTNENGVVQFSKLGYYICTEEKEYMAEVRNMLSEEPEYWVDAHLPALGSMGRRIYTTAKLLDYLNGKELDDIWASEISMEQERIRVLMNDFIKSYSANDAEGMKAYLADGASGFEMNKNDANLAIISYDNLPSYNIDVGGGWEVNLILRELDDPANTHHLCIDLVKQEDGWKVTRYETHD